MNRITITMAVAAILLLFFMGCDKDIRNRYTGDWEFVTKIDSSQFDYELNKWIPLGYVISYSGKIIHGKNNDELIIQYTAQNEVTVWVNHNGNLWTSVYPISTGGDRHGYFEEKDKMYLTLHYSKYGGFLTSHIIEGTKKERM